MNPDETERVNEIYRRYSKDVLDVSPVRIAHDVGFLIGLITRMEEERKDLLARLREATLPDF